MSIKATVNHRVLKLVEDLVKAGKFLSEAEALTAIGFNKNNRYHLREGNTTFTHDQVYEIIKLTGADANWIYGISKQRLRSEKRLSPIQRIKEAVAELESKHL